MYPFGVDEHPLDPPRVGFENLEFKAAVVVQALTTHRHPAQHRESKAAQGFGLFLAFLRQQIDPQDLFELVDAGARIGNERSFTARANELGLDVFENEPAINPKLLASDRVVALPHMGSATIEGRIDMGEKVIINVKTFLDGHNPPDRVHAAMF